ncbi:integrase family protein [Rhizobium leguminosarum bv. trifolii WSM2297]|uniref:Integrase family protein n=1 Tax=Rhizobium leguminosarum bv. trifolii WSM2297 TaxID=754762 RepID=J0W513_RHILT|nr:DDE-type integrase/transposase/recombinase [Rhizobium leguminosarum]EJC80816.1 integrase family protein [Rhizobium leguminosarum bv. trifolii WSM2297]
MYQDLVAPKPLKNPIAEITREDRFIVEEDPYLVSAQIPGGLSFRHADEPWREPLELSNDQIWNYIKSGKAWIDEGAQNANVQALNLRFGGREFDSFTPDDQNRANMRKAIFEIYEEQCLKLGHISRSGDKFQKWINDNWHLVSKRVRCDVVIAESGKLTRSTFNRRYREYKASGRNMLSLVPKHTGPGRKTAPWTPEAHDFALQCARGFMSRLKPTKALIFAEYKAALNAANRGRPEEDKLYQISRTKFDDIIASFPAFDVMAAREGEEYALKHFSPNLRSYNVVLPGKRVEIDEWKGDLFTFFAKAGALEGVTPQQRAKLRKIRLWLVFAIDVATRYVLAVKVAQAPNAEAALGMIRLIMTDKTSISQVAGAENLWVGVCKPRMLVSDHGSALTSDEVVTALNSLNIGVTRPPAGQPKKRPFIESLFHTIGPFLTRFFDGQTFRNIWEKGDYDPKAHASLAASEFAEIVVQTVNDFYHLRRHGSLGGQCPQDAWVDAVETYRVKPAPRAIDMLRAFGKVYTAPITSYGIVKNNVPYMNERLAEEALNRRTFEYKYDETYINDILVKTQDGGWYKVPNTIDLVEDLALSEWDEANKELLAENAARTDKHSSTVHSFLLRNRENGKAATLRAGLDPAVPSAAKLAKMRKRIYTGVASGQTTGLPVDTKAPVQLPPDELRRGTVGRVRPAELQPAPTPRTPTVSNFSRSKWDD